MGHATEHSPTGRVIISLNHQASLKGCEIVAGGCSVAETTGPDELTKRTLKGCKMLTQLVRAKMWHPFRVLIIWFRFPVVFRPPATFSQPFGLPIGPSTSPTCLDCQSEWIAQLISSASFSNSYPDRNQRCRFSRNVLAACRFWSYRRSGSTCGNGSPSPLPAARFCRRANN